MTLTKNQFNALVAVLEQPCITPREISSKREISLGSVNKAIRDLEASGFIADGRVTPSGLAALKPYKVENAVIMAAGLSSRFAPISYEKPKGLLKARGEILIERQIEQLQKAGIRDIVVVVGYKKELFFYLEEKYGVHIVINPEFAARNNNYTLMCVRQLLGNTYICSSDDYFTENPFERYVWHAYYAVQYTREPTDEWCVKTNAKGRIVSVATTGHDAWYMTGHAYFDRAFSADFTHILSEECDDPRTADKLWEQIYAEHVDQLNMEARKYPTGTIYEFDTLDQLRTFDPLFLDNLDSSIFDNICAVLGCTTSEIHDVYPLKQGLTNLSCHFSTSDGEYVYRHPGVGTEKMIDRQSEVRAETLAKSIGLDNTFIFENPKRGWKISRFLPNCRNLDPSNPAELKLAMEAARTLHQQEITIDKEFDYLKEGLKYEALLLEKGPIEIPDYQQMRNDAITLGRLAASQESHRCLTHNDFFNLNLLFDSDGQLNLIDWEYAGMSDYASDYGTFVVTCKLDENEADQALFYYFGRKPTNEEVRHNYAYVALAGWCWYVWALQKESEGDYVGDWLYIYYRYAKKYSRKALSLFAEV